MHTEVSTYTVVIAMTIQISRYQIIEYLVLNSEITLHLSFLK